MASSCLSDSSVICAYLDEAYPGHALASGGREGPRPRPLARGISPTRGWATCSSGDYSIRKWSTRECGARKAIWLGSRNAFPRTRRKCSTISSGELPADGYLFGEIGLADIAIASFFRNAAYAGFAVDRDRWPKVARFVGETLAHPVFEKLLAFEKVQLGASVAGRRQALIDAGARLTEETWGTKEPRRGIMRL